MANILGKLLVELGINTAAFQEGLSKATYQTKKFGEDVEKSFKQLSNSISFVAASFGAFGPQGLLVAEILSKAGEAAGGAIKKFAGMNATVGVFAGAAAGLTVGLASAEAGLIGIALHAAHAAAEAYKFSQSAGVSMKALTGLSFAAKEVGLDTESFQRGLMRLNRTALDAAVAPEGSINAYTRLGIKLRDASGNLRSTEDILMDVSDAFNRLPNGVTKSAIAIQLFGRNGAVMIPLLNLGREELRGMFNEAQELGVVLDQKTGAAARAFEQNLVRLQMASTGVANKLMIALMPALQAVTDRIVEFVKENNKAGDDLGSWVKDLFSAFLTLGDLLFALIKQIGEFATVVIKTLTEAALAAFNIAKAAKSLDWDAIKSSAQEGMKRLRGVWSEGLNESKKLWSDFGKFVEQVFSNKTKEAHIAPGGGAADTARLEDAAREALRKRIALLQDEAKQSLAVAGAVGETAVAITRETAIKKASQEITELLNLAHDKEGNVLENVRRIILAQKSAFESLNVAIAFNNELIKARRGFASDISKLSAEVDALDELADAYTKGGDAVVNAKINEKLAGDTAQLRNFNAMLAELVNRFGAGSPEVEKFASALVNLQSNLDDKRTLEFAKVVGALHAQVVETTTSFEDSLPFLEALNQAYFVSEEAIRKATAALEAHNFVEAHRGISPDDQEKINRLFLAQAEASHRASIAQEAASSDLLASYDKELEKLEEIKAAANGSASVIVKATAEAIKNTKELYQRFGENLLRIGDLRAGFSAFLVLLANKLSNPVEDLFKSILDSIDALSDKLAEFVVTGKANFKELLNDFEKSIVKAGFKNLFSLVGKGLLEKFGVKGKIGESPANPLFVKEVSKFGLGGIKSEGGETGGGNIFSGILGKLGGFFGKIGSFFSSIFSKIGGFFGGIGSFFGGFLQSGGDVTPGKAYIVGERHPEFFVPKQAGRVVPTLQLGDNRNINMSVHFHGVVDHDSFKKNRAQIAALFHQQASVAFARTR